MGGKVNIKEIEKMLPDYISGKLDEGNFQEVEKAISKSSELTARYDELKQIFEFMKTRKLEQPSPQYWNNLLPRIHERIESKKANVLHVPGYVWKLLLPAAAVILIFIIYRTLTLPGRQITQERRDLRESIVKDTTATKQEKPQIQAEERSLVKEEKVGQKKRKRVYSVEMFGLPSKIEDDVPTELVEVEVANDDETVLNMLAFNLSSSADEVEAIYMESEREFNNLSIPEKNEVLSKLKEIDI
jgi:hypothetical protein